MPKKKASKAPEKPGLHFHTAFEKTAKARAALAETDLAPINLDVQVALTSVLGTIPRVLEFRSAIAQSLPKFALEQIDNLKTYAEALAFAQTAYLAASSPIEELPALQARAMEIRDLLLTDVTALAKRGLLDGKPLDELKRGPGYLNTSSDLGVLVRMLRERWSTISSKTAVQAAELDEAEQLFEQITSAYGERTQNPASVAAASDDRHRAYTLLLNAYDEARRAITFLRWKENDVEKIAPSLWTGRGHRTAHAGAAAGGTAPAPANAPSDANDSGAGRAAAPHAPANAPAPPAVRGTPDAPPVTGS
jgi:hypothetical protein